MNERVLRCYIRGRQDRWEGMCLDLDIAVEGHSRTDVATKLEAAVTDYIASALREDRRTTAQLLQRRAPLKTRLALQSEALVHLLLPSKAGGNLHANFEMACPA